MNGKKYDLLPRPWALRGTGRSTICCQDFVSCEEFGEIRFVAKTFVLVRQAWEEVRFVAKILVLNKWIM